MKIVILTCWYTDNMGYAENCLPRSLAKLGHEVHIISSLGKAYFNHPVYEETYSSFAGPALAPEGTTQLGDRLFLHRMPHGFLMGRIYLKGLYQKLRELQPDVVQSFEIAAPYTLQAILLKPWLRFKYFNGNHTALSVFPLHNTWRTWSKEKLKWVLFKQLPGKIVSFFTSRCYAISSDCQLIATQYMGMSASKCIICSLGVDTDSFRPFETTDVKNSRLELRAQLGFEPSDIVCLYTGRFSEDKNPLLLAQAIDHLQQQGHVQFKGLFVGDGVQKSRIVACRACQTVAFVPYPQLPPYYQVGDVGVWPTQDSTSMLDAAAVGLPLVVNDQLHATERIEGNGFQYKLGDYKDLAAKLLLLTDELIRKQMGALGRKKMQEGFSWDKIAQERIHDYQTL